MSDEKKVICEKAKSGECKDICGHGLLHRYDGRGSVDCRVPDICGDIYKEVKCVPVGKEATNGK